MTLLALILGIGTWAWPAHAEVAVIVNRANPIKSISRLDLELIYLGKKKIFDGGDTIAPADLAGEKPARADFFSTILQKDEESYRLYWLRMIFSGRGQPPISFKTEEEAVRFVAANKGAIAFVDSSHISGDVKAIQIVEGE